MIKKYLNNNIDIGPLVLRLGIGIAFITLHGWPKIQGGPELWTKLGGTMSNVGITFSPQFWGFLASAAEFGGGILILIGLFSRTAAFFLAFTMLIAAIQHLAMQDPWHNVFNPIKMLVVFIALIFTGAGKYSLDALFFKPKEGYHALK